MKKFARTIVIILAIIFVSLCITGCGKKYRHELDGATMYVQYKTLNVRASPDRPLIKDNLVGELSRGDQVVLTGNFFEPMGDDPEGPWIEIVWGDGTAWVVTPGLSRDVWW